jgi:outer membrane protein assembly factor BamE
MRKVLAHIGLVLLVAGCSYVPTIPFVGPHKIDVQQGNYVTQDMVNKLQPGMSRSQVRFVLGTPLIADPFHADRWDYVYAYERKGRIVAKRRIAVIFEEKDGPLLRVEGDIAPKKPAVAVESAK